MAQHLGKYELRGVLGSGAAGVVHEAWDPDLARSVAIKQVTLAGRTPAEQEELRTRFRLEAQIAGRLAHPGVVAVYDYGEADGAAFLVMEFVRGRSLAARLRADGRLPAPEAVRIARAMLSALGHCHAAGVLHRDIKPGNVLLAEDGAVKLTDFGIARTAASDLTAQGTLIGTPAYMAPEQFGGGALDARTDVYACAVVLYEMLTGRKPFDGDLFAVMHQVQSAAPPPPSGFVALPPTLEAVLLRAMAKQPADRFHDAAAFAAALAEALHTPAHAPAPRGKAWLAGVATLLLAGGIAVGWRLWPEAPLRTGGTGIAMAPDAGRSAPVPPVAAPHPALGSAPPASPSSAAGPTASPSSAANPTASLRAALEALPCAALRLTTLPDPPRVVLSGLAADSSRADLLPQLARFPGGVEADRIQTLAPSDGSCEALGLVRAFRGDGRLELLDGPGPLHGGEPIRVALRMPDFAGLIRLDYLTEDGRIVVHLDADRLAARSWPAGARLLLGPAEDGVIGTVGEPYGRDLLLVTIASTPLLPGPRPQQETAALYLQALRAAMRAAEAAGARVAADAERVETAPR